MHHTARLWKDFPSSLCRAGAPLLVSALLAVRGLALAAPGDLDATFGTGGKIATAIGSNAGGHSVIVQADGKVIVAGYGYTSSSSDFAVVRYNTNGTLDGTFGTGGKVTTDLGGDNDIGESLALQADGKIVVAGSATIGSNSVFAVVRYEANGTLDSTFGSGGKVTTSVLAGPARAYTLAVQSNGKIVVAGEAWNGTTYDFAVVRYNADGTLDSSFGTGGKAGADFGGSSETAYGVAVDGDGKIVVAGTTDSGNSNFALVRFNANGTRDTSFGNAGIVTTDFSDSSSDHGYSMAMQPDGKIVVAGFTNSGTNQFALARYNTDGSLDTGFGSGGKVLTAFVGNYNFGVARSIALQSDGKIIAAGYSYPSDGDFAVARYNTNGTPDTGFGNGGQVTTAILGSEDYAYGVAVQADGRIVVAGLSYNGTGGENADISVVRYLGVNPPPEIGIEQPVGMDLPNGSNRSFGAVAVGGSVSLTFTIRNTGAGDLTGLTSTRDGTDFADFTITAGPSASVAPGGSTTFTVQFAPSLAGAKTAALHIASNDADENPFDIAVTGTALSFTTDTDGDGLSDAAELQMAALGFDWQTAQPALVSAFYSNANAAGLHTQLQYDANYTAGQESVINSPNTYGLYTLAQVQTLHADVPLLTRDGSGNFKLTIGVKKAANLNTTSSAFPFVPGQTTINPQGKIEFLFTVPDDAAFFRIEAR